MLAHSGSNRETNSPIVAALFLLRSLTAELWRTAGRGWFGLFRALRSSLLTAEMKITRRWQTLRILLARNLV